MPKTIGALLIGQSPRSDLIAPLSAQFDVIQVGALDRLDAAALTALPQDGDYPLTTLLRDGSHISVDSALLAPHLQTALDRLEAQKPLASILLCAGDFPGLRGAKPLIKPFELACATLRAQGSRRLGVVSPIAAQAKPIGDKWLANGFDVTVWVAPPGSRVSDLGAWLNGQVSISGNLDCVVLDYVGYPEDEVRALQRAVTAAVIDLGHLSLAALSSML